MNRRQWQILRARYKALVAAGLYAKAARLRARLKEAAAKKVPRP